MNSAIDTVVIGASAGAIEALSLILPRLPSSVPFAIVVVVHIPSDKDSILAHIFESKCLMRSKEAEDTERLKPGTIYFAPPDYHVLIGPDRRISLSTEEPVMFSRPSIDVLFESAADSIGEALLGVVLTGANSDGARGLRAVGDAGGQMLIQRPDTAFASMMPHSALNLCPEATVRDLPGISEYLLQVGELS